MKIGKTTICAADIDRDKFQISELDPIQNLRKKKKKKTIRENEIWEIEANTFRHLQTTIALTSAN